MAWWRRGGGAVGVPASWAERDGKDSKWTEIGVAFAHDDGKGFTILTDVAPLNASAIVTCHRDGADMAALYGKLEAANVIVSLRTDRAGRKYVRFSPHFYNTDAELERVVQLL